MACKLDLTPWVQDGNHERRVGRNSGEKLDEPFAGHHCENKEEYF